MATGTVNTGGGAVDDNMLRMFDTLNGEVLAPGDVVEFVNNQVTKTKIGITEGTNAFKYISKGNIMSKFDFGFEYLQLTENKMLITSMRGSNNIMSTFMHVIESVGAELILKTTIDLNVYGVVDDMKVFKEDSSFIYIAMMVKSGRSGFLNNDVSAPHIVIIKYEKRTDLVTMVAVHNIKVFGQPGTSSGETVKFVVINSNKLLVVCNSGITEISGDYVDVTYWTRVGVVTLTDNGMNISIGTLLSYNHMSSGMHNRLSIIKTYNGRYVLYFTGGYSTYAKRVQELIVNEDNTVTSIKMSEPAGQNNYQMHNTTKLLDIGDNRVAVVAESSSNGPNGIVIMDLSGPTIIKSPLYTFGKTGDTFSYGVITQPDILDKNKIVFIGKRNNSAHIDIYTIQCNGLTAVVTNAYPQFLRYASSYNYSHKTITSTDAIIIGRNLVSYIDVDKDGDAMYIPMSFVKTIPETNATKDTRPQAVVTYYKDGAARVAFNKSIITTLSGLIPSRKYYVDKDGNLTVNANNEKIKHNYIGTAISDKSLYLEGVEILYDYKTGNYSKLQKIYPYMEPIEPNKVVKLNTDGTISLYNGSGLAIGVHINNGIVQHKGILKYPNVIVGEKYYFDATGTVSKVNYANNYFIGYGVSATEIFIPDLLIRHT